MLIANRHSASVFLTSFRKPGKFIAPVIFGLFLWTGIASAQNQYYVAPTGSDSNNGSQSSPWKTIQHAINSYSLGSQGAVIHVAAGTYTEFTGMCSTYPSVAVCLAKGRGGTSASVRLRLQCDAQWSVPSGAGCLIRQPSARYGFEVDANNVDIVGFDFGNAPGAQAALMGACNPAGSGPCPTANGVHILNNYFHDVGQTVDDGMGAGPGCPKQGMIEVQQTHGGSVTGLQVIGNRISNYGNNALKGSCAFSHGIYINTAGAIVQNNIVMDATANGIQWYSAPCNGVISNNVFTRSGFNGMIVAGGDVCGTPGNMTISNNILDYNGNVGIKFGTGSGAPCTSATPILVSSNISYGNTNGSFSGTGSCANPVNTRSEAATTTFVNYLGNSRDDYHLKAQSSASQTGTSQCVLGGITPCVPSITLDGSLRPNPLSIGPYEATSSQSRPNAPADLTATVN
jgi:hypothetical protein